MGQESSAPINESTPPQTLKARTLDALADHISRNRVKRVVVMVRFHGLLLPSRVTTRRLIKLFSRLGLESAPLLVFQTFVLQTLGFMPIWQD